MVTLHLTATVAVFGLVYLALPRVIFPLDRVPGTWLDRAVAGGVLMAALNIAAMYVLGSIRLLETTALIGVWLLTWYLLKGRLSTRRLFDRATYRALEVADRAESTTVGTAVSEVGDRSRSRIDARRRTWGEQARDWWPGAGAAACIAVLLVILAVSAYLRIERALTMVDLVPQDSFLALSWTYFLKSGRLLADGTYPQGAYMWMSSMDRFYPFGTYEFTRWISPLFGVIELVVLYWVVSRITRSRAAGIVPVGIYGLIAGHPVLRVDWSRQIGSMTQEFGLAFVLVALVYGGRYMSKHQSRDLLLAGCALFMGATSNSLVIPFALIGFAVLMVAGVVTMAWNVRSFLMMAAVGVGATLAANYFFLLGWIWRIPLAQSYDLYDPTNTARESGGGAGVTKWLEFRGGIGNGGDYQLPNVYFRAAIACCIVAAVVGLYLAVVRRRSSGPALLALAAGCFGMFVFYDGFAAGFGSLFQTRQLWVTYEVVTVAIGLGVGAVILAVADLVGEPDMIDRPETADGLQVRRSALEGIALVGALIITITSYTRWGHFDRNVDGSMYSSATSVALNIIENEDRFAFTLVGVSEQYQEVLTKGFFVESWVFAKDIRMSDARNPDFELPVPTNSVYIFAEKQPYLRILNDPIGPYQEYYRSADKRTRIMQRMLRWSEIYRAHHDDMEIFYENDEIRVYKIDRKVNVELADRDPAFKNYTWFECQYFNSDGDVYADRVERDRSVESCAIQNSRQVE